MNETEITKEPPRITRDEFFIQLINLRNIWIGNLNCARNEVQNAENILMEIQHMATQVLEAESLGLKIDFYRLEDGQLFIGIKDKKKMGYVYGNHQGDAK